MVGRDERESCAISRCRCHQYRVKVCVAQQDEARGGTGLLDIHVNDGAVDQSQLRELLKIGVAGHPSFWKQGREVLLWQGCHVPIGLQQRTIPQQDTRDAVLFVPELRRFSMAQDGGANLGQHLGDRLYETGLNRVLHDRDPAIRASAEE